MIHISDLSWTRKYSHPNEAVQKGAQIKCVVLDIDPEKQRVSLGVKQLTEDPWIRAIPEKYIPGHIVKGKVTKLTNFGAFVELEPELEGLLHISELSDQKIKKPQDVVKVDDELEVKILKVDGEARKIGLSLRRAQWAAEDQAGDTAEAKAAEGEEEKKEEQAGPSTELGTGGEASVAEVEESKAEPESSGEERPVAEVEEPKAEQETSGAEQPVAEVEELKAEQESADAEQPVAVDESVAGKDEQPTEGSDTTGTDEDV